VRIGIDLETNLAHNKIWVAKTIDLDTGEIRTWKQASELSDWLKDCTLLTAHNGIGFDFKVLKRLWSTKITMKTYDTLVVSRLLEPSRENGHSLESWGETLGTRKTSYSKIWQWMMGRREEYPNECFDNPIMPLLEYYCEGDVKVLRALFLHLESERERLGFSEMSVELEHQVAYIIAEQEDNGFKLNIPYALNLLSEVKTKLADLEEWFQERWPPVVYERYSEKRPGKRLQDGVQTFNPGSRKQIGDKLKELGWKPEKFTETGQPQVDETTLEGLPWEEAKKLAQYFLLQKRIGQIESWVEAVKEDGRVHGRVITNGAVTGRATHMSPNLAQIPNTSSVYGAECRTCWTVEDENVQVGVDLSGIELRCLAHYLQDKEWQRELLEGDVHWKNTQAFGLVPMGTSKEDSKEHKDKRNLSKTLTYSVLYGAGPAKVGSTVGGTAKEGGKLIDNFIKNTPGLARLKKKLEAYIKKGYVPGLDGRKVWIRSEHAALNSLLQSAGAIIAKQWLVCFTSELTARGIPYKLLAWVHDEVQLETKPAYGELVGQIVAEAATKAGEVLKFRCPVAAEYRVGRNWFDCH
jgi:DNA polymerase I-like protein with 3'-5' exonuclease and polymerase domains